MNRTILDLIKKPLELANNNKWVDIIDQVVKTYNKQIHSTIGETPYNVFIKSKFPKKQYEQFDEMDVYNIGDHVRVLQKKDKLDKKSLIPTYSAETYEIAKNKGNRYSVKLLDGDKIERKKYLPYEMIYASGDKVIGEKK